jgi:hypothetical protein
MAPRPTLNATIVPSKTLQGPPKGKKGKKKQPWKKEKGKKRKKKKTAMACSRISTKTKSPEKPGQTRRHLPAILRIDHLLSTLSPFPPPPLPHLVE